VPGKFPYGGETDVAKGSIKLEINVPAKMRAGITLYADIFQPDTRDRYSALFIRLPYNKSALVPMMMSTI
jgi:predicted acyl esterase